MNKKSICGLLTAAVIFGTCPVSAMAADDLTVYKNSIDLREQYSDLSGTGWKWDAKSMVLTLTDFRAEIAAGALDDKALFYLPDETFIKLQGDNNAVYNNAYSCDIFSCEGEVYVEDDGKLFIKSDSPSSCMIYTRRGPVSIEDEVEIEAETPGHIIFVENARGKEPIISIKDDAKITFHEDYARDQTILVTHKASIVPPNNWINFAEQISDWDNEYIELVKKAPPKAEAPTIDIPSAENAPSTEAATPSTYQLTIGDKTMKKDGNTAFISDAAPYLSHGYTMLPLRALLNLTGSGVDLTWDAATKTISIREITKTDTQYFKNAVIPVGETHFLCGDKEIKLSTPAELKDGRAFLSIRDWMNVLSALDMPASDLNWDSKTKTVTFVK